ncbi:MAG: hypothetical protein HYX75_07575 [Acidobacteria bacterium]|nr:hypothetical protein [Acidobacteriota bacterium]
MGDRLTRNWLRAKFWLEDQVQRLREKREEGAVALEYLLIIGIIVIILFTMLYFFVGPVKNMVNMAINKIMEWTTNADTYNGTGPG